MVVSDPSHASFKTDVPSTDAFKVTSITEAQLSRFCSVNSIPVASSWLDSMSEGSGEGRGPPQRKVFHIAAKGASIEELKGWRKAALTSNPNRLFRYAADLQKREQRLESQLVLRNKLARRSVGGPYPQEGGLSIPGKASNDEYSLSSLEKLLKSPRGVLFSLDDFLRSHGGVQGICERLNVDPTRGLADAECQKNRGYYGANAYLEKPPKRFSVFLYEATQDWTLKILFLFAVVSLGLGIASEGLGEGWYHGTGLMVTIFLGILITAFSDFQQALHFSDVYKEKKKIFIHVTRGGSRKRVSIFDIVVGDIVHLSNGDQIPADGLLIEGYELTVDESTMLGESHEPQPKSPEQNPFLCSGTKVLDGSGLMLVVAVGRRTEWGRLMAPLAGEDDSETPLQVKLSGFATFFSKIGLVSVFLTFLVHAGRVLYRVYIAGDFREHALSIINYFAITVTIIVVAFPEGLPLAVTQTLAFAMKKMMLDKALVRHKAACETMGSVTTICTDSTGTLTSVTTVKAWIAGCVGAVNDVNDQISQAVRDIVFENIYQNTVGDVTDDVGPDGKPVLIGPPTEIAVLELGRALGGELRSACEKYEIVKMSPVNSVELQKMGTVVVKHPNGQLRTHCKGAAEIVLGICDKTIDAEGNIVPMTAKRHEHLKATIAQFGDEGLRTICLAYSDRVDDHHYNEMPARNFVCLAVVGIEERVRDGVHEAVQLCSLAEIQVRMVTGDNIDMATAIARECGILKDDGEAVEGPDFRTWTEEEMDERIPNIKVLAMSSPADKLKLVRHLKGLGEVVAITGDETNDAPALREANIGIAMGIAGTEVTKQSADVIVLDDNFATIVVLAKWGRAVCTNIRHIFQFQSTVILVALLINLISACITGTVPLTAVQLLWAKLIMETLCGLGLASDPPHVGYLTKKAVVITKDSISNIMWRNILVQVVYQLIALGLLHFQGRNILHLEGSETEVDARMNTMIFNAFFFCQIFNVINGRGMEKWNVSLDTFDNWVFLLILTVTVVFQWIIVSFVGKLANTVPLTWDQWLITVGIGAVSILVAGVGRLIPVPEDCNLMDNHPQTNGLYQALPGEPPRAGEIV